MSPATSPTNAPSAAPAGCPHAPAPASPAPISNFLTQSTHLEASNLYDTRPALLSFGRGVRFCRCLSYRWPPAGALPLSSTGNPACATVRNNLNARTQAASSSRRLLLLVFVPPAR